MLRPLRLFRLLFFIASLVAAMGASAQLSIPLQEQVALFNSMSPTQQQALIRELQRQLPPAQREAVLSILMQQQSSGQRGSQAGPASNVDVNRLAADIASELEAESDSDDILDAGDTLVISFERGSDETGLTEQESLQRTDLLERLRDGNPYDLDNSGRVLLPGVPAIALAGLNIEEATIRLRAERELRPFELTLTRLPLKPLGTSALEPFGYDLFRNAPSTFAPATNIPVPAGYVIGPGDSLNLLLLGGNAPGEYFLEVSRDGTINFPELGQINVSGLTIDEARNLINERVDQQIIGADASITLGELKSINVFVLGDVIQPGSYTVSGLATMTNALFSSGGVADIGTLRRIELRRAGELVTRLDLYDLLLSGDTSDDARLQQDDVIFVPRIGDAVAVDGQVRRPAIYELDGEQTVADLIELAGGLLASADPGEAKLERIVSGRGISVLDIDVGSGGQATVVRDGDVLRIERNLDQLEGTVRLAGNVQREGLYQWQSGMTVSDLLPSPELVKPLSDLNYVLIRREPIANIDLEVLSLDLEAVWEGRLGAADLALEPRDTVFVFHQQTGRHQYVAPIVDELEAQVDPGESSPIVRVAGRVRAEGIYPLEPGMRVSDLLRAGGGLSDSAYASEAELTRYSIVDGEFRETELINVDLDAIRASNGLADLPLLPYDFLSIREISGWRDQEVVSLRGEFVFPGDYPIRPGETLRSVLARAGGLTEQAFSEGSVFTREAAREREMDRIETEARRLELSLASMAISETGAADVVDTGQSLLTQLRESEATGRTVIRLDEIVAGTSEIEIELQDGDTLYVPERSQEVTVIGEVQYPTSHIYEPGLSRDDYIERSGGTTRRADKRRVYIVRANGEVVTGDGMRWFRRDEGGSVRPGDTIVAPLDIARMRPLTLWSSVTQIIYNMAIAAAAVNSF